MSIDCFPTSVTYTFSDFVRYSCSVQFSIHAFISDKSPHYTGYINYNHRLLILY